MPRFNILLYYYRGDKPENKTKILVPNTILKDVNDLQILNNPNTNNLTKEFNKLCEKLPKISTTIQQPGMPWGFSGTNIDVQMNLYAQILGSDAEYLINKPQIEAEIKRKKKQKSQSNQSNHQP